MPNKNSILLVVLTACALALGIFSVRSRHGAMSTGSSDATVEAHVFVFGSLARAGDASSFRAHRGWRRVVDGHGRTARVSLVIVPERTPRASLTSDAAILAAQSDGRAFVIETPRTVRTSTAQAFRAECAANATATHC